MKKIFYVLVGTTLILTACSGEDKKEDKKEVTESPVDGDDLDEDFDFEDDFENDFDESEYDHSEFLGPIEYDETKMKKWPKAVFRSDGFRPGLASEWIKVIYTPDREFIAAILYWNVDDETPIVADLIETEYIQDEIAGWIGEIKLVSDNYEFGIIEDRFTLTYDSESPMQEFYYED